MFEAMDSNHLVFCNHFFPTETLPAGERREVPATYMTQETQKLQVSQDLSLKLWRR